MRFRDLHLVDGLNLKDIPRGEPPEIVTPMLATLVDEPFNRENWVFEVKWDGYRAIADLRAGKPRLYSRNFKSFDEKFQALRSALERIPHDVVLDGEIVALDTQGISQFQLLQEYQRTKQGEITYYVFDILFLDGHDLRDLPLLRRKEFLRRVIPSLPNILVSDHIEDRGIEFFHSAQKRGLEGIVAKDAQSRYRGGYRTEEWLKIKTHLRQEFVIGGFIDQSVILGVFDDLRLHHVGQVDIPEFETLQPRLEKNLIRKCPFENIPISLAHAHWVQPKLVCEVSFREWTQDGILRQPKFDGLRIDKPVQTVKREKPKPVEEALREESSGFLGDPEF